MRQIQLGAWLLSTTLVVAACGGERFTTDDRDTSEAGATEFGAGQEGNAPPPETSSGGAAPGEAGRGQGGRTSGGSASAGGASQGGSSPNVSGGKSGGAGGGDVACATGKVTIRMKPSPDLPDDYLCDAGCGTGWLTITDARGAAAFTLFSACGSVGCDTCSLLPCAAAACLPTPLTSKGNELEWTGSYLAQDACGLSMLACQRTDCAPPGRYKAKACAAINGGSNELLAGSCLPRDGQVCAETEFDFPGTSEVELVLEK
jgi:hypothetical protein